jgi:hypothetical protein
VPDVNRGSAFAIVFVMCALQILAKAAATALLAATSGTLLLGYVAADHALHLAYRLARRDFVFFIPMPAAASAVVGLISRVIIKVITDFTGTPQTRLPLIGGGAYWLFSLVVSQASVFACVHLYLEHAVAPGDGVEKVQADVLWKGAGALAAAWTVTFLYFVFRVAVPKFRHTLWSWATGRQVVQDYIMKGGTDEAKFAIFGCNLLLWESDVGAEVKAWAAENWARWRDESPPWFKVEQVPDRFIPAGELAVLGHNRKRRGSAAGSVRESFREGAGGGGEE